MNNFFKRLAPAMVLCLPLLAGAQQRPDTTTAKVAAPALGYQSVFADYKPWQDIKPGSWRQLNDNVAAASGGGHAGHSMGGAASADAPASASKPSAPPAPAHQGHQMHGGKP